MDESLFDEFGNYIGPVDDDGGPGEAADGNNYYYDDDGRDDGGHHPRPADYGAAAATAGDAVPEPRQQQIVLHEDKKYYLTAEEVYGPDVETLVQDEDTQPLSEPVIAPLKVVKFQREEPQPMPTTYEKRFMLELMCSPGRVRNVVVCGALHHGKTALLDVLVDSCHPTLVVPEGRMPRFTDTLFVEQERGITLKAKPLTLLLPTSQGTSTVLNLMDTPGHADFGDELAAAARIADGMLLVVDVVEGLMAQAEICIRYALALGLPIVLVLNKVERLFLELKLPPTDAYYKLRHCIEEVNTFISAKGGSEAHHVSPELGNVLFASTLAGWIFSLESFARIYVSRLQRDARLAGQKPPVIDHGELAKRLWGDIFFDSERGTFKRIPAEGATKRTFISFILEPLYKIYGHVLSEERTELQEFLDLLGITLKGSEYGLNTKTVLRIVCGLFFGKLSVGSLVDALVERVADPQEAAFGHVMRHFTGSPASAMSLAVQKCDAEGPLVAFAVKAYPKGDASTFDVLVRVLSGTLRTGQRIRILGEDQVASDEATLCDVAGLSVGCGRYRIPTSAVPAGSWALVAGVNDFFHKTGTIVQADGPLSEVWPFKPLMFLSRSYLKLAIEPVVPSELPKMLDGLRKISKSYPSLHTKVEDSGEHTLLGAGELYMDCALYDLRRLYADIEVKVADPVSKFAETVAECSYLKCFAETANQRNRLTMLAEPLEKAVIEALEAGRLPSPQDGPESARDLANMLREEYGWDILAARSVWAFGPDPRTGPCVLLDDTLPSEVDKESLELARDYIIQGFQWACREGPLCEEMVRGVKFRLLDAIVAPEAVHRGAGQIIPAARRVCYSAMLTASPRLMEPVLAVEIQTQNEWVEAAYAVLAKRRGHVTHDAPRAGSSLYSIRALLPLMDSFGFETDLRIHSHGMACCQMYFCHWQVVSGDPLDRNVKLIPLEPSAAPQLARDYLVKTRRRKGLGEDVVVSKFFDKEMLSELAREEAITGIQGLQV